MPTFEETLIENSPIKEAKLYSPSKKAIENPSNGITVNVPAAANVIKDCATLARSYIPHYVFGHFANPFSALRGKFNLDQIKDLVQRSSNDIAVKQLILIILNAGRFQINNTETSANVGDDPYGDYESASSAKVKANDDVYQLCKLFGII